MKPNPWTMIGLLVVLALGIAIGQHWDNRAMAQIQGEANAGPYQISAYSSTADQSVHHGCYVVDTRTGQVWHTRMGGTAEKISGRLQ